MIRNKPLFITGLAVFVLAISGAIWYWVSVYAPIEVPMEPLPPVPTVQVVTVKPEVEATVQPPVAKELPKNPRGEPVQMVIFHGDKVIASMRYADAVYGGGGDWGSRCGKVTYRDRDGFPKPGYLSKNRSLSTGHVWCERETYSLDNLDRVKAGDLVEVHYSLGDVVVGVAEHDAAAVLKGELNMEKAGERNPTLRNTLPARTLRVSTCDTDSVVRPDGHLSKNMYVLYTVTEIRYVVD